MKLLDFRDAVVTDLKTVDFLKDVAGHGRIFNLESIKRFSLAAPACRIAIAGVPKQHRNNLGQFIGPVRVIGFLVETDRADEARDKVIELADTFAAYVEHRTWGLLSTEAGPALVQDIEILYTAEIDQIGAAIAMVTWDQEVVHGRNLYVEDEILFPLPGPTQHPEEIIVDGGVFEDPDADDPITIPQPSP